MDHRERHREHGLYFRAPGEALTAPSAWRSLTCTRGSEQERAFDRWAENAFDQIEERANGGGESGQVLVKNETRKVQRSAAPHTSPPASFPPGGRDAKAGDAMYIYGAQTDRPVHEDHRLDGSNGAAGDAAVARNEPLYAVGLVFMEDKTLGFPRIFVRDVLSGSSAEHNSRLKRGDLLVMADNEDVYGRDLDYVATILPGRYLSVSCLSVSLTVCLSDCLSL